MAKAVRSNPNPNPKAVGGSQGRGGWSRPWGPGHGRGDVAKAAEAWSRPWGHDQGRGSVAKVLGAWPRP